MQSALDLPTNDFSEYEKNLVSKIREHGWFHTSVLADETHVGFSYSTGFWLSPERPELIVFSLGREAAQKIFWQIYRAAQKGDEFAIGQRIPGILGGFDAIFAPVAMVRAREYLLSTCWFYGGEDFPCSQIIWPDQAGLFPWEPGASAEFANSQPDLSPTGWRSFAG